MATSTSTPEIPIPQPPPHWLLGNIPDIDSSQAMLSTMKLAKLYGPIVRTDINGVRYIRIGSQALAHEICDDERFEKKVSGPLREVRHLAGTAYKRTKGLFTAETAEPVRPDDPSH
ncbi:hypothetical protein LTR86_009888 [Recurvomyces mirabilis]|nr:hypothetical protein LTR86_009888 [Recurvomyces mirabilis]